MALIAVFMVSCVSPLGQYQYTLKQYNTDSVVRDIPIIVDLSFDHNDMAAIDNAIAQWNYALNGWIHLHVVARTFIDESELKKPHDGWLFYKALSTDQVVREEDKLEPAGFVPTGFVNYIGGNQLFIVRERTTTENVFGVTLHEIGHLLGAKHLEPNLMRAYFDRYYMQCIDRNSLEEVAQHEKLPIETLNYCTLD